jgi:type VI secretion system protein ImpG
VTSRLYGNGPISFIRGLEINLTLDEDAFRGMGIFLLGAILDRYFGATAQINSFTQTVLHSVERGKIKTWPKRSSNQRLN